MKLTALLLTLLLVSTSIPAQQNIFSSADIVINSNNNLAPQRLDNFSWIPLEDAYTHVQDLGDGLTLIKDDISSGIRQNIITLDYLNNELRSYEIEGLSVFPKIEWVSQLEFRFNTSGKTFTYNYDSESLDLIFDSPYNAEEHTYSPDNKYLAYVLNNDLYYHSIDEDSIRITLRGSDNVTNGKPVSRNEFGIKKGIFWSPDNKNIAFYREDLSEVSDYPYLDISTTPASINYIKYPMAGEKSSSVKIGIYNLKNAKTTLLNTQGPYDQYLTSVTWSPDSKHIYVAHLNRDQNHLKLIKYDAATGEPVLTLFEEQNDKYIEPEHGLTFIPSDPSKFIWFSEKDGWNHIYLYGTDGKLLNQLTQGKWVVNEILGFDKNAENIYLVGTKESVLERHLYLVNLKDVPIKKLTVDKGTHKILKHPVLEVFLDEYSNLENPGNTKLFDSKGHTITTLIRSEDPYSGYSKGGVKIFSIKGENEIDLYCKMFYPVNFNEKKKYPAIVYVYGGPHKQLVQDKYPEGKYDLWAFRMAEEGYFVFMLDNRGSDNRGIVFEQTIFGQLGTYELKDQLTGIEYLKSLPYIDPERLGVYGWSYGGFMSISLMTKTDNIFKAGIAGGPVIDWSMYEVMYTERYMNTPDANRKGYIEANLLNYAGNLSGRLLVIHGMQDSTVVPQQSLRFIEAAVEKNKPLDYFQYPGYGHHVKGVDAIHLYDKIIKYFLDNL